MENQDLQVIIREMSHWGYAVMQRIHPTSPGYRVLAIALRTEPTKAHFDPEVVTLTIYGQEQLSHTIHLHHNSPMSKPAQACVGSVVVQDRVGKQVSFYTFGGQFDVVHTYGGRGKVVCSYYVLQSLAPIMPVDMDLNQSLADQLASEAEAELARLKSHSLIKGVPLHTRLAKFDPLTRYAGCIATLLEMYHGSPPLSHTFPELLHLLEHEGAWVRQQPNIPFRPLEKLLAEGTTPYWA